MTLSYLPFDIMSMEANGFVERSYEFSSNFDRVHALQVVEDGMSGETVPVEEAEAMDLSAVDADIDVEESVRIVDGIGSFGGIEFSTLTAKDILTTEFINLQAAYDYYNEYGRIKGFSVRRSKVGRRTKQGAEGEIIWQIFVCSWEGERNGKHMQQGDRKMDPRPITRCGCETRIKSTGFETVGFEIKDIYNAIEKQRRVGATNAEAVLKFLATLRTTDCGMLWKYSLDGDKRLENLFWYDGTSRYDYSVFGDILGFDATTVVFGCAILSNESEENYVWLLRSFLEAMKEKQPKYVMTDRDLAMKSAVSTVFLGLKTTSRCEALNMHIGKFIHNGYNLREFVEHFQHYLECMRRRELVADYKSAYGEPIVKTKLEAIEQFAATVYTKEVFELFREVLMLASNVRVVFTKRTNACVLFEVAMYCKQRSWAVSSAQEDD
ncbi:protein FAR1-RELATED SEQUENCE 5-like [Arachis hypogaea]